MDPVNQRWLDELFGNEERSCPPPESLPVWYQKPLLSVACPLLVPDPFGLGQMVKANRWCCCERKWWEKK